MRPRRNRIRAVHSFRLAFIAANVVAAIYDSQPFRAVLRDLGLTSNQVWGLTKIDDEWSRALDVALTATRVYCEFIAFLQIVITDLVDLLDSDVCTSHRMVQLL